MKKVNVNSRRYRSGFTLVELLVVIGIIAVLIAMLLPAISKAMVNSRNVACQSNMRQLAVWGLMYANDGQGTLPTTAMNINNTVDAWPEFGINSKWALLAGGRYGLYKTNSSGGVYTSGTVLHCPEASIRYPMRPNGTGCNYAINEFLGGRKFYTGNPDAPIPRLRLLKSTRIWFVEGCIETTYSNGADSRGVATLSNLTGTPTRNPWTWPSTTRPEPRGHPNNIANLTFGDGHVEGWTIAEFKTQTAQTVQKRDVLGQHY